MHGIEREVSLCNFAQLQFPVSQQLRAYTITILPGMNTFFVECTLTAINVYSIDLLPSIDLNICLYVGI